MPEIFHASAMGERLEVDAAYVCLWPIAVTDDRRGGVPFWVMS
jgi:hypothetical protein